MWCKCWSLHDLWYFLAGAAFWDMLVHIGFQAYGLLPISIWGVTITSSSNYIMIGFAAMLCFVFYIWRIQNGVRALQLIASVIQQIANVIPLHAVEVKNMVAQHNRTWIFFALLFVAGSGTIIVRYLMQACKPNDELIANHIMQLKDIFKRINDRCKITAFRNPSDLIDFLNVGSFAGSVVGSMNLLEPQNWEGPYLSANLTREGKEYQIVGTKKGYYIVPGDGVKLANGKVIGKTLSLTPDSNFEVMLQDPQALLSNNRPLGAFIETYQYHHEPYQESSIPLEEIETLD